MLKKPTLPVNLIQMPDSDECIYIKSWSQRQKNLIATSVDQKDMNKTYVKILAASICDIEGKLSYTEKEAEELLDFPSSWIEKIVSEAYAFNGVDLSKIAEKKSN